LAKNLKGNDGSRVRFLRLRQATLARAGKDVVRQVTAKNRYARALAAVTDWCRRNRHQPIPDQHAHLIAMMRGHYAYYGITGNFRRLRWYADQVEQASPSAGSPDRPSLHLREQNSSMKNRKREFWLRRVEQVRSEDARVVGADRWWKDDVCFDEFAVKRSCISRQFTLTDFF
jgi:hypothetical protein